MLSLVAVAVLFVSTVQAGYIPPVYYGEPLTATTVELQGPDFRGDPVYLIEYTVELNGTSTVASGIVHRSYDEFLKLVLLLNQQNRAEFPWLRWEISCESNVTIQDLNTFLDSIIQSETARLSVEFSDFLGINWNADGVEWFQSLQSFMYFLLFARVPHFQPEPPVFDSEAETFVEETAFEKYMYMTAFRAQDDLDAYLAYFDAWVSTNPAFEGAEGDSDVWFPGATAPLELPYHYTKTFVHFLPGGYTNGRTVRISYCGNTKFNFLKEPVLKTTINELFGNESFDRILDIGTGNCYSAFVYGEEYPDAEVYGIELAAPYVRFCNMWKETRPSDNVLFYQDNAESTHFESESFDLIQYTYVLHEMPEVNAEMVIQEAMRLLKPGGIFVGFEVPFIENAILRRLAIEFQTWGCDWNATVCDFGPEPYMGEYEAGTQLPRMLERIGFVDNTFIEVSAFDGIYVSYKPE